MLFDRRIAAGIAEGSVTSTFRRWRTRQAIAGHRYRTPAGMIEVDDVTTVEPGAISDADARRSGYPTARALLEDLRGDPSIPITYVRFHAVHEPDPRDALAADDRLSDDDIASIERRLASIDARSRDGAWTMRTLRVIAARPAVRAADLAAAVGSDTVPFKRRVRTLKELGLTRSLEIGYRLSRRGEAFLRAARR
ncbi:MAG TPA: hypothetical protein VIC52_04080 [Actinomycetota bacterium]|jgi:hypothetical protein